MSVVTLAEAKLHLRVTGDGENTLIQGHINAAEQSAAEWMGRLFYGDQTALTNARAGVPGALAAATEAYVSAVDAAGSLSVDVEVAAALKAANDDYINAQTKARMVHAGLIIDDAIRAAVLLIVGSLYEDREQADIPRGALSLLQPKKVYG